MARILPWKRREQKAFERPDAARSDPAHEGAKKGDNGQTLDEANLGTDSESEPPLKGNLKRPRRSTSTSCVHGPPQEDYMVEGADGDDRYRMVEDEFLATARQYTAHLHAAEYKRLKAATEVENAQAIKDISRPVVGRVTDIARLRKERQVLVEKQRLATKKFRATGGNNGSDDGSDDGGSGSWQQQSLYGLMESPGKRAGRLDGVPAISSVTRAAAGYNRQTAGVVVPSREKPKFPSNTNRRLVYGNEDKSATSNAHDTTRRIPQPLPTARAVDPKTHSVKSSLVDTSYTATDILHNKNSRVSEKEMPEDEDMDFMEGLKRRKEERRRSRAQRKSTTSNALKSDVDDILPGFL